MGLLEGRMCLVTGAAQGLGQAMARAFSAEGARVALLDLQADPLPALQAALPNETLAFPLDLTDYERFAEVVAAILAHWGRIDVLVNNAGIYTSGTVLEDNLADWRKVLAVNVEALYMGCKLVAPAMVAQKSGRIINIASIAGFASRGRVGSYNASKGAVIAYTKSLAVELAPYGILVNALAPGFVQTPMMVANGADETQSADFLTWYVGRGKIPLRRVGVPEDVAGTAIFLASDYCRYMTGQVLVVDGGLTSTF
jgi:NAD(P)-dependent dehydrogenase (short-subunit alcohol dehydrogenase family)